MKLDLHTSTGAHISSCGQYRYALWRNWNSALGTCAYIMLNPSTADAIKNDPTITRCIKRAESLNFGGIIVANLFAYRTAYPSELLAASHPIGEENDAYLGYIASNAAMVICAWGNEGNHLGRDQVVKKMLDRQGIKLFHLGLTKSGNPLHPLARGKIRRIPYGSQPYLWSFA